MQTLEALKTRRSVRVFKPKPIDAGSIEAILEAGGNAPTARNVQPWEFIVVTKKEVLHDIASLAENGRFIKDSACCIAVFCDNTKYYLEDGCSATVNILNAAHELGIGSCWVAGDKKPYCESIRQMLGCPAHLKLVSLIALGYPQEVPVPPGKRPLNEIIHKDKF
ncbi:MAG: nitroreductase family protein [Candidatus Omnitrophota bacterium]|jgi:nitroreductase|nr:MAG: nitroreductase family protein [Candidatus Omnitrophota bacterium]